MALLDDALSGGNLVTGLALGALALALPPLRGPLIELVAAGAALFVEAEFEVEGAAIETLVEETIKRLLAPAAGPAAQRQQADAALHRFHHKARARSHRWGRDEPGRQARYRRHVGALKRALAQPTAHRSTAHAERLGQLADTIVEDW